VEHHEAVLENARSADLGAVIALLSTSGLPTADIERHIQSFVIARWHGHLIGTVGFENYGELGLLRSLCVEKSRRGQGTGRSLVSAIEAVVSTHGVREVYLLTTAAARYFETKGFATIPRDQAPDEIRQTTEFRSLCPSSAICMRKSLPHVARYVSRALLPLREDIPGAQTQVSPFS
jgi:amino-acid N-acetyltransferase